MLALLSPSKYSPFEAMHRSRRVFRCSKQSWKSCEVLPITASIAFFFTFSTSASRFPLWTFFLGGGTEGNRREPDRLNRGYTKFHVITHSYLYITIYDYSIYISIYLGLSNPAGNPGGFREEVNTRWVRQRWRCKWRQQERG